MLYINKNRVVFSHKKRLITPVLFFPLLLSLLMSSCDCDDNPLPNSFNRTGLYLTRIEIDKQNVNLNSFTPISNVSLRPSPLASFSFSFPVASIHIDSIKKYLSIVSNSDNKELPFNLSRGANDSSVYIDLPSGASLERGKSYNITLRGGLSVETDANRKFSLNKPYSVRFTSVSKSNNTDLSVSYLGNDIVASDAGVFTIDAKELTKLPVRIPLKLRVDPSSKVEEGNTSLTVKGDSMEYAIDVSSESETRTIIVMAEDGRRKQYTIVINVSGAEYTVRFNTNGGDAVSSQTIHSGSKVEVPSPSPMKTADSVLENWYSNAALTTVYDFSTSVTSNLTLYAKWKFRSLSSTDTATVMFNTNSGSSSSVASIRVRKGNAVSRPTSPTRAHFTFNNWYSNSSLTTVYDFSTSVTSDLMLYAKWDTVKYTITFNTNDGDAVSSQTIHSGSKVEVPSPSPMKMTDSVLENWYSNSALTTVYDFSTSVTSNFTLYAKWKFRSLSSSDTATVTFASNRGSAVSSVKARKGNPVTKPTDPTRTGYRFNNWYSNLTLTTVYDFSTSVTSDLTLYAKWDTVKYTVAFNSNGGSAVASQNVDSGGMAVRPTNPTRANFTFNNWYSNAALTMVYNFGTTLTGNVTLYAKWDTAKYTITFNTDGGSAVSPQQVTGGAKAALPPPPAKIGLYFAGWSTKAVANLSDSFSFSGAIVSDTTLYAKWTDLFGQIILSGKIPNDISLYDYPLLKETIGNGNYQAGANIALKHVKYGGDDNNDGSSWSRAYASVSKALSDISDASPSKVYLVLIAASPNEYAAGASMSMKNNTAIMGGFSAQNDYDYAMSQTDTTILSGNNTYVIFDNSNLDLSALLYGVKMVKGRLGGSGMEITNNQSASISVTNVIFAGNDVYGRNDFSLLSVFGSGGIYKNTLFINNYTDYGSVVDVSHNSNPIFVNSIFTNNRSVSDLSIISVSEASNPIIINANFSENYSTTRNSQTYAISALITCQCFPIAVNSIFSSQNNDVAKRQRIDLFNRNNNLFLSNGYINNGKNAIQPAISTTQPPYVIYENMTEVSPSAGTLGANGGFILTMPISSGSSAVDLGLYAKVAPGNVVYFSEDKISWFQIGAMGEHVAATPPADAKDLNDIDGRGYKRIGRPDAGAYEAGATP